MDLGGRLALSTDTLGSILDAPVRVKATHEYLVADGLLFPHAEKVSYQVNLCVVLS